MAATTSTASPSASARSSASTTAASAASVRHLTGEADAEAERGGLVVNAVRANVFDSDDLLGWDADPVGTCARIFGRAAGDLVEKYELDIARRPIVVDLGDGGPSIGYRPTRHFGTFIATLAALDERLDASAVREHDGPGT